jgi:hypothetical protein
MTITTLTTYSDATCLVSKSAFYIGETIYLNGYVTESVLTVGTSVKIEHYNNADVLQDTPQNDVYGFVANTPTLHTTIKGGNITTTAPATPGSYYFKLTISGVNVETYTLYVRYQVISAPTSPLRFDGEVFA